MGKPDKMSGWQDDRMKRLILSSPHLVILSLIIIAYLIIGAQYAALTPRWQVPDEPAHFNYIRYLVDNRSLPTLDPGEYQQGYLAELTSKEFPPELSIDSLQYESWQPPLYYLLAAPIFAISNGDLFSLRLFSLIIGAGVIVFTYLAVCEVFPDRPFIAATAAGFIAFIPQHIAMMAGINNDSLSELLIAIGLWRILRANRLGFGRWDLAFLSAVLAAAFITKSQAYVLAPVAGVMLLFKWRRDGWGERRMFVQRAAIVFVPALIVGSLFWARNVAVYGWPDFMASIRHDQVVADQPRTKQWIEEFGTTEVLRRFGQTTFQSFWGQFGWMGVVMDRRVYWALGAYSVGWVVGLGIGGWRLVASGQRPAANSHQLGAIVLLTVSALLTLGLYLYYNLTYVQHQGRYLFPALIPIGLGASVSLWAWAAVAEVLIKRKIGWLVPLGALVCMAALDVFALYRFILPALPS